MCSGVIARRVASVGACSAGVTPWQLVQLFWNRLIPVLSESRWAWTGGMERTVRNVNPARSLTLIVLDLWSVLNWDPWRACVYMCVMCKRYCAEITTQLYQSQIKTVNENANLPGFPVARSKATSPFPKSNSK